MMGRGASGVPVPEAPLDFAAPPRPDSPNWWMALPPDEARGQPRCTAHALPGLGREEAWRALLGVAGAVPRCFALAMFPERRQAQWVVRSALFGFPDVVVGEAVDGGVRLHSRSLMGWSDLGVNRRRVEAWLAALDRAAGR